MDIIFEDNSILVCYKPAGLATQTRKIGEKDMESEALKYLKEKGERQESGRGASSTTYRLGT